MCQARLRCAKEPMSIIDLLAILPFWLALILQFAAPWFLQILRALRLVRLLRTLRLAQESAELRALVTTVMHALPALRMLCFFLVLELVIIGGLVFHAERGDRPLDLSDDGKWQTYDGEDAVFQSIPDAAWWTLVTVTTVGYGKQVPVTFLGKLIASVAMLSGLIGISSIISILSAETQALRASRGAIVSRAAPAPGFDPAAANGTGLAAASVGLIASAVPLSSDDAGLRPLTLTPATSRADLDAHLEELRRKLDVCVRACDDPATRLALSSLAESAMASLGAFQKVGLDSRPAPAVVPVAQVVPPVAAQPSSEPASSC